MTTQEQIAVEEWKDICGYNGMYQISTLGRIRSTNYLRTGKTKILKQATNNCGYKYVVLRECGKKKNLYIHRLVASAFIDNTENLPEVDHIDTSKTNNVVTNLRWVSHEENQNNPISIQKMIENNVPTARGRCGKSHVRSKSIIQYDMDGNFIKEWDSINLASIGLGLNISGISLCCNNIRNKRGGFIWKFKQ